MGKRRTGVKWALLAVNLVALVVFAFSYGLRSDMLEGNAGSNYYYLEHAGVIDSNALARSPDPGFAADPRGAFIRRIAGPALDAQKGTALDGLILAIVNLVLALGILVKGRRAGAAPEAGSSR